MKINELIPWHLDEAVAPRPLKPGQSARITGKDPKELVQNIKDYIARHRLDISKLESLERQLRSFEDYGIGKEQLDDIKQEIEGYKKINKDSSPEITTRLKHQIVSVDGNKDKTAIKEFVENYLLAADSRALRLYIKEVSPDVDLVTKVVINGVEEDIDIPINLNFFWPDL